jgi:hypothetical protein
LRKERSTANCRQRTGRTSPFKKFPVIFRTLSVTLANETRGPSLSPIYQKYLKTINTNQEISARLLPPMFIL